MSLIFPPNPVNGDFYSSDGKTWIYNSSIFAWELETIDNKVVYLTGSQTISGVKTFVDRPLVNGTGVLLSGEFANTGYLTGYSTINYTNQISGNLQTEINKLSVNSIAYAIALG